MACKKCYKLQLKQNDGTKSHDGVFLFDEFDHKGFEEKAHLSTIDAFTTRYKSEDHLKLAVKRRRNRNGVTLEIPDSSFIISSSLVLENVYKTRSLEGILYEGEIAITEIPLINLTSCDIRSREFRELYKLFSEAYKDEKFRRVLLNNKDFPQELLKAIMNKDDRTIIEYMKQYNTMRRIYKDTLDYQKIR